MNNKLNLNTVVALLLTAGDEIEQKAKKLKKVRKERSKKMAHIVSKGRKKVLNSIGIASAYDMHKLKKRIEELKDQE